MTRLTVEDLACELQHAYEVIECAVPLALRLLKNGDASLKEQRFFWDSIEHLEHYIDVFDDPDNLDNPFDDGELGIPARQERLKEAYLGLNAAEPESASEFS